MQRAERITVHEGDCLAVLPTLEAGSFDAVITDPPYPCIKRSYGTWTEAEWWEMMRAVVPQCMRLLKPTGSAVFILQSNSERIGRMRTWLWDFMAWVGREWGIVQDVWWHNHQTMPTLHCTSRYGLTRPSLKACVWVGPHDCRRDQSAVLKEPAASTHKDKRAGDSRLKNYDSTHHTRHSRSIGTCLERGGASPFNVLTFGRGGGDAHGAATPLSLCRWWVRYLVPPDGTVLDPFFGSGTVGVAALQEGRLCVGIEQISDYVTTARRRIAETLGEE